MPISGPIFISISKNYQAKEIKINANRYPIKLHKLDSIMEKSLFLFLTAMLMAGLMFTV
jgi:hypothetical protein